MPKLETAQYTFSGTSLKSPLSVTGNGSFSYSQNNNLTLSVGASSSLDFVDNVSYDLRSSYIFIQLVNVQGAGLVSGNTDMTFSLYDTNYTYSQTWEMYGTTLQCSFSDSSAYTQLYQTTYNPAVHKWLKISESGGTVYFSYSTDGKVWVTVGSKATALDLSVMIWDVSLINNGTGTLTCVFDNMNYMTNNSFIPFF